MCILEYAFSVQAVYSCALVFTFCLYRPLRLARDESLGLSEIFPENVYNPRHGLLDSRLYKIQRPLWPSRSPNFPLKFFVHHLFFILPQLLLLPEAAVMLKNCYLLFSTCFLGEKVICTEETLSQVK